MQKHKDPAISGSERTSSFIPKRLEPYFDTASKHNCEKPEDSTMSSTTLGLTMQSGSPSIFINQSSEWSPAAVYGIVFGSVTVCLATPGAVVAYLLLRERRRAKKDAATAALGMFTLANMNVDDNLLTAAELSFIERGEGNPAGGAHGGEADASGKLVSCSRDMALIRHIEEDVPQPHTIDDTSEEQDAASYAGHDEEKESAHDA